VPTGNRVPSKSDRDSDSRTTPQPSQPSLSDIPFLFTFSRCRRSSICLGRSKRSRCKAARHRPSEAYLRYVAAQRRGAPTPQMGLFQRRLVHHRPPVTLMACPVMYPAPSDARKATTSATSSGVVKRPKGLRAPRRRISPPASARRMSHPDAGPGSLTAPSPRHRGRPR